MGYQKSLAERRQSFLEDACATCGGGGSEEGGGGGEYEPGADDELALGKALKKLKNKKKRDTPVSDTVVPEDFNLGLKRDKKVEVVKEEVKISKKAVLETALKVRKELM